MNDYYKEDLKKMRLITKEAILAGAFGFSTSRTISHKSLKGEYTPTLRAHEDELTEIALGMKDAGAGFMEIVSDWNEPDPETEFNVLKRISKASGLSLALPFLNNTSSENLMTAPCSVC